MYLINRFLAFGARNKIRPIPSNHSGWIKHSFLASFRSLVCCLWLWVCYDLYSECHFACHQHSTHEMFGWLSNGCAKNYSPIIIVVCQFCPKKLSSTVVIKIKAAAKRKGKNSYAIRPRALNNNKKVYTLSATFRRKCKNGLMSFLSSPFKYCRFTRI